MGLTGTIKSSVLATLTGAVDIGEVSHAVNRRFEQAITNGTGANQANALWSDQRTIAASGSEVLDLAGVLTDAIGATLTFTSIKGIFIYAAAANVNDVVLGGAASNAFDGPFADSSDKISIPPGGKLELTNFAADGWAVVAGTGDQLQIANSGSGTGVTYDIILIGEV